MLAAPREQYNSLRRLSSGADLGEVDVGDVFFRLQLALRHSRTLYGHTVTTPQQLFHAIDKEKEGVITLDSLKKALDRLDLGLSKPQIDSLLHTVDEDSSKSIDLEEWLVFFERWKFKSTKQRNNESGDSNDDSHESYESHTHDETDDAVGSLFAQRTDLSKWNDDSLDSIDSLDLTSRDQKDQRDQNGQKDPRDQKGPRDQKDQKGPRDQRDRDASIKKSGDREHKQGTTSTNTGHKENRHSKNIDNIDHHNGSFANATQYYNDADPVLPSLPDDSLSREAVQTIKSLNQAWNEKKRIHGEVGVQIMYRSGGGEIEHWDENDPKKVQEWKDTDSEPIAAEFNDWDAYFVWLDSVGEQQANGGGEKAQNQAQQPTFLLEEGHRQETEKDQGHSTNPTSNHQIKDRQSPVFRFPPSSQHGNGGNSDSRGNQLTPNIHMARSGSIYVTYEDSKQPQAEQDYDFTAHAKLPPAPAAVPTPQPTPYATNTLEFQDPSRLPTSPSILPSLPLPQTNYAPLTTIELPPSPPSPPLSLSPPNNTVAIISTDLQNLDTEVKKTTKELEHIEQEHKQLEMLHKHVELDLTKNINEKRVLVEEHRQLIASGLDTPDVAQRERELEDQIRAKEAKVIQDARVLQETEVKEHELTGSMEHLAEEIALKRAHVVDELELVQQDKEMHHKNIVEGEHEVEELKKEYQNMEKLKEIEIEKITQAKQIEHELQQHIIDSEISEGSTAMPTIEKQELAQHLKQVQESIQTEEQKLKMIVKQEETIIHNIADQQTTVELERELEQQDDAVLNQAVETEENVEQLIGTIQSTVQADLIAESHNREAAKVNDDDEENEKQDHELTGANASAVQDANWRVAFEKERNDYQQWMDEQKESMELLKQSHHQELALSEAKLIEMKETFSKLEKEKKEEVKTTEDLKSHLKELLDEQVQVASHSSSNTSAHRAADIADEIKQTEDSLKLEEQHIADINNEEQHIIEDMKQLETVVHSVEDLEQIDQARETAMVAEELKEEERGLNDEKLENEVAVSQANEIKTIVHAEEIVKILTDKMSEEPKEPLKVQTMDPIEQLRLEFSQEREIFELERQALRKERLAQQQQLEKERRALSLERKEYEQVERDNAPSPRSEPALVQQLEERLIEQQTLMQVERDRVRHEKEMQSQQLLTEQNRMQQQQQSSARSDNALVQQLQERLIEQQNLMQAERDRVRHENELQSLQMQEERERMHEERSLHAAQVASAQVDIATALNKAQTEMATMLREQSQAQNDYNLEFHKTVLSPTAEQRALAATEHSMLMTPNREGGSSRVISSLSRRASPRQFYRQVEELESDDIHFHQHQHPSPRHNQHYAFEAGQDENENEFEHNHLQKDGQNKREKGGLTVENVVKTGGTSQYEHNHKEDDKDSLDLEYENENKRTTAKANEEHESIDTKEVKQLRSRLVMLENQISSMNDEKNMAEPVKTEHQKPEHIDPLVVTINARIDELEGKVSALSPSKTDFPTTPNQKKNQTDAGLVEEIEQMEQMERKEEEQEEQEIALPLLQRTLMEHQIETEQQENEEYHPHHHHHHLPQDRTTKDVGSSLGPTPAYPYEQFERSLPTMKNDDANSEASLPGYSIPMHEFTGEDTTNKQSSRTVGSRHRQEIHHEHSIWSGRSVLEDIIQMRVELESALKVGELTTQRAHEAERIANAEAQSRTMMRTAELHRSKAAHLEEESHTLTTTQTLRTHINRVHDEVQKFMTGIESRHHRGTSATTRPTSLLPLNSSPTSQTNRPRIHISRRGSVSIEPAAAPPPPHPSMFKSYPKSIEATDKSSSATPELTDTIEVLERPKHSESSEQQVLDKLKNMMAVSSLRPIDTVLFSKPGDTAAAKHAVQEMEEHRRETSLSIEMKLREAARLRREADILSMKAQASTKSPLEFAQSAVQSFVRLKENGGGGSSTSSLLVSQTNDLKHSKLLNLKSRIRELDRSLDRGRSTYM